MSTTLSLPRPAANRPHLRAFAVNVATKLWNWRRQARNRAELRALLERADDRMLADVGLNRATLADEAGKGFWQD